MTRYDFSPLFRSTVGFDRFARLVDAANRLDETAVSYPPYNIEKLSDEAYRVTMAVAGFSSDELEVVLHDTTLIVTGKGKEEATESEFLHRGIARRAFERRFQLADHIKVSDASLANGLLTIGLVREVPEERKPRKIIIGGSTTPQVIEQKAA